MVDLSLKHLFLLQIYHPKNSFDGHAMSVVYWLVFDGISQASLPFYPWTFHEIFHAFSLSISPSTYPLLSQVISIF